MKSTTGDNGGGQSSTGGQSVEKLSEIIERKTGSGNNNNNTVHSLDDDDTFLYETKYVVLNFMKMLPKDVNERSWTPVSSASSDRENFSEASQRLTPISEQDSSVDKVKSSMDGWISDGHHHDLEEDAGSPLKRSWNVSETKRQRHSVAEKRKAKRTGGGLKEPAKSPPQIAKVPTFVPNVQSVNLIDDEEETNGRNDITTDNTYTSDELKNGGQEQADLGIQTENNDKALDSFSRSTSVNSSHGDGSYYSDADDELDCSLSSGQQSSRSSSDTKLIMDPGFVPASNNGHFSPEAKYSHKTGSEGLQHISSAAAGARGAWIAQGPSDLSRRTSRNPHEQAEEDSWVVEHSKTGSGLVPVSDGSSDVPDGLPDQMSSSSTSLKLSSASGKDSTDMQNSEQPTSSTSTDTITTTLESRNPPDRSLLTLDICKSGQGNGQGTRHPKLSESMNSEIMRSWTSLESEVEEAIRHHRIASSQSPFAAPLTPESEAARILSEIACQVDKFYGERLENAVREAFPVTEVHVDIPYEMFRSAAIGLLDDTLTGWNRVALLLVYSQRLTFAMVQSGHQGLNYLVDHAARLVADKAADFIISQGGWGSVAQAQISSSSSSQHGSGETSRVNSPEKWLTHPVSTVTKVESQVDSATSSVIPPPVSSTPVENPMNINDTSRETLVQTDLNGKLVEWSIPKSHVSCSSESDGLFSDSSHEVMADKKQEYGEHKPGKESKSYISAEILKKAHSLGFSFSIAAAVIIVGIAIVLSKH